MKVNSIQYIPQNPPTNLPVKSESFSLNDWLFSDDISTEDVQGLNAEIDSISKESTNNTDRSKSSHGSNSPTTPVINLYSVTKTEDTSHTDIELQETEEEIIFNTSNEISIDFQELAENEEEQIFTVKDFRKRPIFSDIVSRVSQASNILHAGVKNISNKYLKTDFSAIESLGSPSQTRLI